MAGGPPEVDPSGTGQGDGTCTTRIIRAGTVVDGRAPPAATVDVAITDGIISEVGAPMALPAGEFSDADGLLVTPDSSTSTPLRRLWVTWDPMLTLTCWHGVTTVVMGNCGVGFAPV